MMAVDHYINNQIGLKFPNYLSKITSLENKVKKSRVHKQPIAAVPFSFLIEPSNSEKSMYFYPGQYIREKFVYCLDTKTCLVFCGGCGMENTIFINKKTPFYSCIYCKKTATLSAREIYWFFKKFFNQP